jgi:hypothetical protein
MTVAKIVLPPFQPTSRPDLQISGSKTVADWTAGRRLLGDAGQSEWSEAFEEFLFARLRLRYLAPIKALQTNGVPRGEGFSIVAIQVTLIEFLAACILGASYRYVRRGDPPLTQFEYSQSGPLFAQFLVTTAPFNREFSTASADDFCRNVRCGLLHEARTKQGWSILADSGSNTMVDTVRKVVFRNDLQRGLEEFLSGYRRRLATEMAIQEAFIRKIDSLCVE